MESVEYYSMDPKFKGNSYPENGTVGYDGKGWYCFHHGQLFGPYDSEKKAEEQKNTLT